MVSDGNHVTPCDSDAQCLWPRIAMGSIYGSYPGSRFGMMSVCLLPGINSICPENRFQRLVIRCDSPDTYS